jgi:hypothetical protein
MNAISAALPPLHLSEPVTCDALTIYPLLRDAHPDRDYLTLDEALARKSAAITEVSHAGHVPELMFRNLGDAAVFLLDGEELVGAKQNRVLNISILAPAHRDTVIPVSCVEAGRWHHVSADFKSAERAQFSASRAKRAAAVSEHIVASGFRRSDQAEVWSDIDDKLSRLHSHSASRAVEAAFADHESVLCRHVEKLAPRPRQVGGVFEIKGVVVGLELFDSDATCGALLAKVIRSYALDAIDPHYAPPKAKPLNPQELLRELGEAPAFEAQAIGEGTDIRFAPGADLCGGALLARGRLVHLIAFVADQRFKRSLRV